MVRTSGYAAPAPRPLLWTPPVPLRQR